ncbi:MAG: hypothetical protein IJ648_01435, partial [Lachnospiraceae bacterium]|nr:hypothetical protein [Lachnospiraceae bacterium]
MTYQYNNSNHHTISGAGLGKSEGLSPVAAAQGQSGKTSVSLGTVGDIITGTVVQTGKDPIVEMNGTPIHVRSDVLDSVSKGDQIYLRITANSSSEITLKMIPQEEMEVTSHNGAIQTEIMKNTANFVEQLKLSQAENNPNYQEFSKEATLLADSITDEERQQLREMGIDISSANLAVVKTLVSQMRGQEQETQLQKNIDSVKHQILLQNPDLQADHILTISLPYASETSSAYTSEPYASETSSAYTSNPSNETEPSETTGTSSPVNERSAQGQVYDIGAFTQEVNDMLPITDDQTTYLIRNKLPLTADNLYKSGHAGRQRPNPENLDPTAMEQLRPQMERAILTAGQEITDTTLNAAEFLLQKNLPLTSESLNTYLAIQELNHNGISEDQVADHSVDYLAEQSAFQLTYDKAATHNRETSDRTDSFSTIRLQNMNLYFPSADKV